MAALIIALLEQPEERKEIKDCLEKVGYDLIVVNSFLCAKSVLREHSFDLIISDVHLENGGSVFDFLKWIKSDPKLCAIPFVLFMLRPTNLAKYLADGVETAARLCGAAKYISMDEFDSAVFAREISELLPHTGMSSNYSYERR